MFKRNDDNDEYQKDLNSRDILISRGRSFVRRMTALFLIHFTYIDTEIFPSTRQRAYPDRQTH